MSNLGLRKGLLAVVLTFGSGCERPGDESFNLADSYCPAADVEFLLNEVQGLVNLYTETETKTNSSFCTTCSPCLF